MSGGSKAHWLARSFSEAFLMRSAAGHAVDRSGSRRDRPATARCPRASGFVALRLEGGKGSGVTESSSAASEPPPHRFEFVHNTELRPVLERAYYDSRRALEQADYDLALRTSCGILEAIVTDALRTQRTECARCLGRPRRRFTRRRFAQKRLVENKLGKTKIADWSFDTRLVVAERAGLIRGGAARLPAVARTYRDHADDEATNISKAEVSEREARVPGQVLHVSDARSGSRPLVSRPTTA